jgi:hypothetical protein
MSDPTQPPARPDEGAPTAPPAGSDAGGTPPPPPPAEPTAEGAPPPPPAKKNRTGLVIVAAALVLLLVAAGAVAAVLTLGGGETYKIATTSSAGEMKRDTAKEKELKTQLDAAEQQFKTQDTDLGSVTSAVYNQDKDDRGPKGALVFLGGNLKDSDASDEAKEKNAAKFLDTIEKQASQNGFKVTKHSVGEDGKAVCAAQEASGQKIAICAWATNDTRGELIPTVPGWESDKLGEILSSVRSDVETAE